MDVIKSERIDLNHKPLIFIFYNDWYQMHGLFLSFTFPVPSLNPSLHVFYEMKEKVRNKEAIQKVNKNEKRWKFSKQRSDSKSKKDSVPRANRSDRSSESIAKEVQLRTPSTMKTNKDPNRKQIRGKVPKL